MDIFPDQHVDPYIKWVFDHWHFVRGDRTMPAHRDIDFNAFGDADPWTWVCDLGGDGEFYFRQAGKEVERVIGGQVVGGAVRDFLGPIYDDWVKNVWLYVARHPAIYYLPRTADNADRHVERLIVPLTDDNGQATLVLGITRYLYRTKNIGQRFPDIGQPPSLYFDIRDLTLIETAE